MQLTEIRPLVPSILREAGENEACIVWEIELPDTCTPNHCRLGFERQINEDVILIDRDISYSGQNATFRRFLEDAEFAIHNTVVLQAFLGELEAVVAEAAAMPTDTPAGQDPDGADAAVDPDQVAGNTGADAAADAAADVDPARAPVSYFHIDRFKASLRDQIKGQDAAIDLLAPLIFTAVRKRRPKRPLALVFAGNPGIGKTLLATSLAEAINAAIGVDLAPSASSGAGADLAAGTDLAAGASLGAGADVGAGAEAGAGAGSGAGSGFGTLRVDMNQLGEPHNTSRFWGAPPGYVGYDDAAIFEPLFERPRQVIVFDEMEKADPRVMQTLMNAMASGRLEAARVHADGVREFDFSHTILVFTTNIPLCVNADQPQWKKTLSCKQQLRNRRVIGQRFAPEIVNRFSEILVFADLTESVQAEIARLSITRLASQFELAVASVDADLLEDFRQHCVLEEGVREFEYMAERIFGPALAAFEMGDAEAGEAVADTVDGAASVATGDSAGAADVGDFAASVATGDAADAADSAAVDANGNRWIAISGSLNEPVISSSAAPVPTEEAIPVEESIPAAESTPAEEPAPTPDDASSEGPDLPDFGPFIDLPALLLTSRPDVSLEPAEDPVDSPSGGQANSPSEEPA